MLSGKDEFLDLEMLFAMFTGTPGGSGVQETHILEQVYLDVCSLERIGITLVKAETRLLRSFSRSDLESFQFSRTSIRFV